VGLWLSINNPNQVVSVQKVSVLTGEPNTWLFIYSGLATIEQDDQAGFFSGGEDSNPTINIAVDNIAGELLGYATTASLANITGSGGVEQYDIQSVSLALQDNGDLVFTATLYVYTSGGNFATLGTYSYYVSAKILLETPTISGTIRWKKTLATPLASPHFVITANVEVPGGPGQFPTSQVVATGSEGAVNAADATYYYVPYSITGVSLGQTVTVNVAPNAGSFSGAPGNGFLTTEQISGPNPITLTNSHLDVANVDFEMDFEGAPQ
jgi:hypothetical protein